MVRAVAVLFAVSALLYAPSAVAHRALMVQPLSFAWNSPLRTGSTLVVEVPLVAVFDWTEDLAWAFEVTPSFTHGDFNRGDFESRKLASSIGLTIRGEKNGGFFATPKILNVIALEGYGSFATLLSRVKMDETSSQFSFGADVGYEWRTERLVIAVVAGVSAGVGANLRLPKESDVFSASLIAPPIRGITGPRIPRRPVMDVNLNLLRVGVPF